MADTTPEAAGSRERAPLLAEAPGRVNLIGEHTDYNAGLVLPVALPLATRVALLPRDDGLVRVRSRELGSAEYRLGAERRGRGWLDHVQALTVVLAADGFTCEGFEASIASDVPIGSGLASSAALAVALLRAIRAAFALRFDDVRLALLAQRAENEFVGARVGVMDQLAASLGRPGVALFIDTRSLDVTPVPLPDGIELGVVDSGVRHEHAAGGYNERRAECERAASLLGVRALGELGSGDLERLGALPPPLDRRARHVVTEDARVREMVAALRAGDLGLVGALLTASHRSLRDDFAVSVPEVDRIVALAAAHPAVVGARLTGGGFGGAVLFVAERGTSREVASRVAAAARAEGIAARAVLPVDPPPASRSSALRPRPPRRTSRTAAPPMQRASPVEERTRRALPRPPEEQPLLMPPEEAWRRVDGKEALLLDVVGTTSWERLSAVPAPAIRIPPEELRDRIDELPFEREIISFCT